jgi:hypothetical protein
MKNQLFKLLPITLLSISLNACTKEEPPIEEEPSTNYTLADFTTHWKKAWGTSYADDFAGAVIDNTGFLYFTGSSQPDGYLGDIFVTKINLADQSKVWSVSLDAGDRDHFPSPSENGHSNGGGGSRCLAIDNNGDIYIAGSSAQGYNEVFVVKINSSGTIVWQKFWKAANTSVSSASAKAYALDISNNKIFITGSTGAGTSTEESHAFLLVLNTTDGSINANTQLGIDLSSGYNDRGYTVKSPDGNIVYIAGWEGQNNSGFVAKMYMDGSGTNWHKRVNLGVGARFTDLDLDASGNLYLGADYRGVSTFIGVMKMDASGSIVWSTKFHGLSNDRNNVSCVRVINNLLYVGGRGSFDGYDTGQFGDGCLLRYDLNGNLQKQYNFFTGELVNDKCGERIEGILPYNNGLILIGETWPEFSGIDGRWYIPAGTSNANSPGITTITNPTLVSGTGFLTTNSMSLNTLNQQVYNSSSGSQGSADILITHISQ